MNSPLTYKIRKWKNALGKTRIGMKQWKLCKEKDSSISLAKEFDVLLFYEPHILSTR